MYFAIGIHEWPHITDSLFSFYRVSLNYDRWLFDSFGFCALQNDKKWFECPKHCFGFVQIQFQFVVFGSIFCFSFFDCFTIFTFFNKKIKYTKWINNRMKLSRQKLWWLEKKAEKWRRSKDERANANSFGFVALLAGWQSIVLYCWDSAESGHEYLIVCIQYSRIAINVAVSPRQSNRFASRIEQTNGSEWSKMKSKKVYRKWEPPIEKHVFKWNLAFSGSV